MEYIIKYTHMSTTMFIHDVMQSYIDSNRITILSKMKNVHNMITVTCAYNFNIHSIQHPSIDSIRESTTSSTADLHYIRDVKYDVPWHLRSTARELNNFPDHTYTLHEKYYSQAYHYNLDVSDPNDDDRPVRGVYHKYKNTRTYVPFVHTQSIVTRVDPETNETFHFTSSQNAYVLYSKNAADLPLNWAIGRCTLPNDDLTSDIATQAALESFEHQGEVSNVVIEEPLGIQSIEWDLSLSSDKQTYEVTDNTTQWASTTEPSEVEWPVFDANSQTFINSTGNTPIATDPIIPAVHGCTEITATNYDSSAEYDNGSCTFTAVIDTAPVQTQRITLHAGNNFMSTFIDISEKPFEEVFQEVYDENGIAVINVFAEGKINFIKDQSGNIFSNTVGDTLLNAYDITKGYIVNVHTALEVVITGNVIQAIQLHIPANIPTITPYLQLHASTVSEYFRESIVSIESLLTDTGKHYTADSNTGAYLIPGHSYQIIANQPVVLTVYNNVTSIETQTTDIIELSDHIINLTEYADIPLDDTLGVFASAVGTNKNIRQTISSNLYYPDNIVSVKGTALSDLSKGVTSGQLSGDSTVYPNVANMLNGVKISEYIDEIRDHQGRAWTRDTEEVPSLTSLIPGHGYYINSSYPGIVSMSWAPDTFNEIIHIPAGEVRYIAYTGPTLAPGVSNVASVLEMGHVIAGTPSRGNLDGSDFMSSIVFVEDEDGLRWDHSNKANPTLLQMVTNRGYKIMTSGSYGLDIKFNYSYESSFAGTHLHTGWNLIGYTGLTQADAQSSVIRTQDITITSGENYVSTYIDVDATPIQNILAQNLRYSTGEQISISAQHAMGIELQTHDNNTITATTATAQGWDIRQMYIINANLQNAINPHTGDNIEYITLSLTGYIIGDLNITLQPRASWQGYEHWISYPLSYPTRVLDTYKATGDYSIQLSPSTTINHYNTPLVDLYGTQVIQLERSSTTTRLNWIMASVLVDSSIDDLVRNNITDANGAPVTDGIAVWKDSVGAFWSPGFTSQNVLHPSEPYTIITKPGVGPLTLTLYGLKQDIINTFPASTNVANYPNYGYFHTEALPVTHNDNPIRPLLPFIELIKDATGAFWTSAFAQLTILSPGAVYHVRLRAEFYDDPFTIAYINAPTIIEDTTQIYPGQGIKLINTPNTSGITNEAKSFTFQNNLTSQNTVEAITTTVQHQSIEIVPGWSMISSYLDILTYYADEINNSAYSSAEYLFRNHLYDASGTQVTEPFSETAIYQIKNHLGELADENYSGQLEWSLTQGYQIKNNTNQSLYLNVSGSIIGDIVQPYTEGWQIIPALHPVEVSFNTWITSLSSNISNIDAIGGMPVDTGNGVSSDILELMKTEQGEVWQPGQDISKAQIKTITPGKAYQINTHGTFNVPVINTQLAPAIDGSVWQRSKVPTEIVSTVINEVQVLDYDAFIESPELYTVPHTSIVSNTQTQEHIIPLYEGYNIVGTYIDVGDVVFSTVVEQSLYYKDPTQEDNYVPVSHVDKIYSITYVDDPGWNFGPTAQFGVVYGATGLSDPTDTNISPMGHHIPSRGYQIRVTEPNLFLKIQGPVIPDTVIQFTPGTRTMYYPALNSSIINNIVPTAESWIDSGWPEPPYIIKNNSADVFWQALGVTSLNTFTPSTGFIFQWPSSRVSTQDTTLNNGFTIPITIDQGTDVNTLLGDDAGEIFNPGSTATPYLMRFTSEYHARAGYKLEVPGQTFLPSTLAINIGENVFTLSRGPFISVASLLTTNASNVLFIKAVATNEVIWTNSSADVYLYLNKVYIISAFAEFEITI